MIDRRGRKEKPTGEAVGEIGSRASRSRQAWRFTWG